MSFFNETKTAITTNNGVPEFCYYLRNDEFSWKKGNDKLRIIYGKVHLMRKECSLDILFKSVEMISNLTKDLKEKCKEQEVQAEQHSELKRLLKSATEAKEKNEKELFIKFISLLNSKKSKINDLKAGRRLSIIEVEGNDLNEMVVESSSNHQSSDSPTSTIPIILPKRRKFEPVEAVQPTEKKPQKLPKPQPLKSTQDLFDDM